MFSSSKKMFIGGVDYQEREYPDVYFYFDGGKFNNVGKTSTGTVSSWSNSASGDNNYDDNIIIGELDLQQATESARPRWGGNKITFDTTARKMSFNITSVTDYRTGWVITATSRGIFTFKVNNTVWKDTTIFGRLNTYNFVGDVYGLAFLPLSSSESLLEEVENDFILNGAPNKVTGTTMTNYFRIRTDITEFKGFDAGGVTFLNDTWRGCSSLSTFPMINIGDATSLSNTWNNCNSLTAFPLLAVTKVLNFSNAWQDCKALLSFPSLSTTSATNLTNTWYNCESLLSFPLIPINNVSTFQQAWRFCSSLVDFPAGFFDNWNPSTVSSWCFSFTWKENTSLSLQSVENIFNSIAASGVFATANGTSSANPIFNKNINVDYDTSTGAYDTASTTIALLKQRNWVPILNGVTL